MVGIPFQQIPGNVLETPMDAPPGDVVVHWAFEKAMDVMNRTGDRPVLGADTMVALEGCLLGKPGDEPEAVEMLSKLSGRWHSVFGGVSVLWPSRGLDLRFSEETRVRFRELSTDEIAAYVATGEPMDKAGAYGIQGYGSMLVDRVDGCFFNVMGLPVARLVHRLREELELTDN
jgi:septum formation protein